MRDEAPIHAGKSGLRQILRVATTADHRVLDALGTKFDLASRSGYAAFLSAHASLIPALENLLDKGPVPPRWPQRRRAGALAEDLAALGRTLPEPADVPDLASPAQRIGALYVLEGSRLGGAILLRHVTTAQPDAPVAFLDHRSGERCWATFVEWLDGLDCGSDEQRAAIEGARLTFAAFAAQFRAWLATIA